MAHGENIDAHAIQTIDQGVALQHIADDVVVKWVAPVEQLLVDLRKYALHLAQRSLDGGKIERRQLSPRPRPRPSRPPPPPSQDRRYRPARRDIRGPRRTPGLDRAPI